MGKPSKPIDHFLMNAVCIHLCKTPLEKSGFQTANGANYVYPLTYLQWHDGQHCAGAFIEELSVICEVCLLYDA
jgi:hypothetical protein